MTKAFLYLGLSAGTLIYACSIANVISTFVIEDHMLDWHSCQICYPLEIKILLLLYDFRSHPLFLTILTANRITHSLMLYLNYQRSNSVNWK